MSTKSPGVRCQRRKRMHERPAGPLLAPGNPTPRGTFRRIAILREVGSELSIRSTTSNGLATPCSGAKRGSSTSRFPDSAHGGILKSGTCPTNSATTGEAFTTLSFSTELTPSLPLSFNPVANGGKERGTGGEFEARGHSAPSDFRHPQVRRG